LEYRVAKNRVLFKDPVPGTAREDLSEVAIAARLRSAGLKATPQRIIILKELLARNDHPTAETLYRAVKGIHTTISFNTIYNTLQILTGKGLINVIRPVVDAARYDGVPELHGHFMCSRCKQIEDHLLEDPNLKRLDSEIKQSGRYWMVQSQILWVGICNECKEEIP
jgi:Fur family peroxide stress response transcriptional regulator